MRLDKFLFFVRVFKNRNLASKLILSGIVRINGSIVKKGHRRVIIGEIIVINRFPKIQIIKVLKIPKRRGSYSEAKLFYEDLSPKTEINVSITKQFKPFVSRIGRPTKMDRRKIDKLMGRN